MRKSLTWVSQVSPTQSAPADRYASRWVRRDVYSPRFERSVYSPIAVAVRKIEPIVTSAAVNSPPTRYRWPASASSTIWARCRNALLARASAAASWRFVAQEASKRSGSSTAAPYRSHCKYSSRSGWPGRGASPLSRNLSARYAQIAAESRQGHVAVDKRRNADTEHRSLDADPHEAIRLAEFLQHPPRPHGARTRRVVELHGHSLARAAGRPQGARALAPNEVMC